MISHYPEASLSALMYWRYYPILTKYYHHVTKVVVRVKRFLGTRRLCPHLRRVPRLVILIFSPVTGSQRHVIVISSILKIYYLPIINLNLNLRNCPNSNWSRRHNNNRTLQRKGYLISSIQHFSSLLPIKLHHLPNRNIPINILKICTCRRLTSQSQRMAHPRLPRHWSPNRPS